MTPSDDQPQLLHATSVDPQAAATSQRPPAWARNRALLLVLAVLVVAWLATMPLRIRMLQNARRLNREADAIQQNRRELVERTATITAARAAAQRAVDASPNALQPRLDYANALAQTGDLPEAVTQLVAANHIAPRDPRPLIRLGEVYDLAHEEDLAIAAYRRALELAPADPDATRDLAYRYVTFGWNRLAEQALNAALARHPNDVRLHVALGMAAFQSGEYAPAIRELETARRLAPADPSILGPLAGCYRYARRYQDALKTIAAQESASGDQVGVSLERARVYDAMGDPKAALAAATAAERLDRQNVEAHYLRGVALRELRRIQEATAELNWVHTRDPKYERTAILLGQLMAQQGLEADARRLSDEARQDEAISNLANQLTHRVATEPQSAAAHRHLADLYLQQHNWPRAIVELRETLRLDPHDHASRMALGDALADAGRGAEAQAVLGASRIMR